MGHPFGPFGSAVLPASPPIILPTPKLLAGVGVWAEWERDTTLTPCEHCSAAAKTPVCYQYCFSHRPKTFHWDGELTPSQPDPVHLQKNMLGIKDFAL